MTLSDFDPSTIKESLVTNASSIYSYGDTLFDAGSNNYKIMRYTLGESVDETGENEFRLNINAESGFSVQIWYKKTSDSSVTRVYSTYNSRNGNKSLDTLFLDKFSEPLDKGDSVYFVIYNSQYTGIKGSISLENADLTDDVSGSAYTVYSKGKSVNLAPYTKGYNEDTIRKNYGETHYMNNEMDIDAFYINNVATIDDSYSIVLHNAGVEKDNKQVGTSVSLVLYYVDFSDDSHFLLKKQSSTRIYAKDDKKIEMA